MKTLLIFIMMYLTESEANVTIVPDKIIVLNVCFNLI
jgi:hypothetical protein